MDTYVNTREIAQQGRRRQDVIEVDSIYENEPRSESGPQIVRESREKNQQNGQKTKIWITSLALTVALLLTMLIICIIFLFKIKTDSEDLITEIQNNATRIENILKKKIEQIQNISQNELEVTPGVRDCAERKNSLLKEGKTVGERNVAILYPFMSTGDTTPVMADCVYNGSNAWMVIQRRIDGSVDFYRRWESYAHGFGSFNAEYWIGLRLLHKLTTARSYKLRIDLMNWKNEQRFAEYSSFRVGDESSNFTLNVSGYSGNAVDSMGYHDGRPFSTFDRENDRASWGNCAIRYHGGWWYDGCYKANLNGRYYNISVGNDTDLNGVSWELWLGLRYSLKFVAMKIQPN